jgi:hypothetical protein
MLILIYDKISIFFKFVTATEYFKSTVTRNILKTQSGGKQKKSVAICYLDFIHCPYIFNHNVSRDGSSLVIR